ncbi:MAG: GNAT family N-acetyltransferase [Defluviitaleaceae bacterium]|nr:GNAT family N-acetyltransferase [Defluviitaleaceae bacterium]
MAKYYKRVEGEKVYLSPICTDDVDIFMSWVNEPEMAWFTTFYSQVISRVQEKDIVENKLAVDGSMFSIVTQEDDRVIGNCNFFKIDALNRAAEVGIIIGEKDCRGKGYGSEALRLLLKFGFENRNYNNISLHVYSFNERAIACYEKVGFKRNGICRQAIIRGNKKYDLYYMDILAEEYFTANEVV